MENVVGHPQGPVEARKAETDRPARAGVSRTRVAQSSGTVLNRQRTGCLQNRKRFVMIGIHQGPRPFRFPGPISSEERSRRRTCVDGQRRAWDMPTSKVVEPAAVRGRAEDSSSAVLRSGSDSLYNHLQICIHQHGLRLERQKVWNAPLPELESLVVPTRPSGPTVTSGQGKPPRALCSLLRAEGYLGRGECARLQTVPTG